MVTLAGTQNLSEFELHARAIIGWPIPEIKSERNGASAVVLAEKDGVNPEYSGVENVLMEKGTEVRIFGKPTTRPYRRMGVVLTYDGNESAEVLKERAKAFAKQIKIISH